MPLTSRIFHRSVGDMKDLFDKKVEEHKNSQLENPFSEWEGAGRRPRRLSREDADYGRPRAGSVSERRAEAAQQTVMGDIKYLCNMIWDCSEWRSPDGRAAITFGKLFNLYIVISDKVVGTLLRARKHGFVYFTGEMLYQRRDDDKVIELTRNINTIRARFGQPPVGRKGGEIESWESLAVDSEEKEGRSPRGNSEPPDSTKAQASSPLVSRRHSLPHAYLSGCMGGKSGDSESEEEADESCQVSQGLTVDGKQNLCPPQGRKSRSRSPSPLRAMDSIPEAKEEPSNRKAEPQSKPRRSVEEEEKSEERGFCVLPPSALPPTITVQEF